MEAKAQFHPARGPHPAPGVCSEQRPHPSPWPVPPQAGAALPLSSVADALCRLLWGPLGLYVKRTLMCYFTYFFNFDPLYGSII